MDDREKEKLQDLVLAPYLQKAAALIGRQRQVGGNQFRHAMATLAILIDYHFTDPVLLKASVIHDLIEECPETDLADLKTLDQDAKEVLHLVLEVTRRSESKAVYLKRLLKDGSYKAKVLKVADRISNLTDLHDSIFSHDFVRRYIEETAEFIYPIALEVNPDMALEISDLIHRRRRSLEERYTT